MGNKASGNPVSRFLKAANISSNRPEHMTANVAVSLLLGLLTFALMCLLSGFELLWNPVTLGMIGLPLGCFLGEYIATADRDHPSANLKYWWLYRETIPYHRHPRSHSLLPGTLYRFIYGAAIPISCWAAHCYLLVKFRGDKGISEVLLGSAPTIWGFMFLVFALLGMFVGDCVHLTLDGYSPGEWAYGRKSKGWRPTTRR